MEVYPHPRRFLKLKDNVNVSIMAEINISRDILNSKFGLEATIWLARTLPPRVGNFVADLIGGSIGRQRHLIPVKATRANLWVISDFKATPDQLNRMTVQVFQSAGRTLYEFFHYMEKPKELLERTQTDPSFEIMFENAMRKETGTILVTGHIGNFDLVGRAMALRGLTFQGFTPPVKHGGYELQNRLRAQVGMEMTPASLEAVRKAHERLRKGGMVVTGVDRPVPDGKHLARFFGLPASLTSAHVRLALKLNLPVNVLQIHPNPKGYLIKVAGPIPMERCSDPDEEVVINMEKVLKPIEENVRQFPVKWNMTYNVWPQIMHEVP